MFAFLLCIVTLEVNSKIDSVVIYSDRVMVTRIISVYLDKTTDIIFTNLPGAIDDASVRVKAGGLKIGEVQIKKGYLKEPHPKVKELQEDIKLLEIEDRALLDEIMVLNDKEKFLQTIAVGGPDVISQEIITGKVSPESWRLGLKFMVDELLRAKARKAEIDRERAGLEEEMNAFRRELQDIKSIVENRKTVIFTAHLSNAQNYDIKLSYILHGANWRTYYELRANPSLGEVGLSYFAKINQRTGEDWENTNIVLSTAKPALAGVTPKAEPWYIRGRILGVKEKALYYETQTQRAVAVAERPAETIPTAPPIEAGISIWYPLPGRHIIKSGDPERKIKIYETSFDADFEYFIIPRVAERAYSTGKLQNTSDYLFLAGEAGTYVGDDFTGKTFLSTIAPDESTTVSFGVVDRVRDKRELKKSKVSKAGLFSNKTKYEFTYENSVVNFHNRKIKCSIVDQAPISQSRDIKVTSIKCEPKPTDEDKDLGIYYWRVPLSSGTEYKINISFTVEAPSDVQIEGLIP
ncbi:MAG: DUF4139 domain-containing protein [candidate division WOR-3 bacterium]|nr:MAG: DUF4139 domain-containing protein [candidate division WOR-3 bacterium]